MQASNGHAIRAIVLDDDADTRFAIKRILGKCGCEVSESESVSDTLSQIKTNPVDVVFSDLRIPGSDGGEELLAELTRTHPEVAVILMSCAMDDAMGERFMEMGATGCVQKPFYKDTCEVLLGNLAPPLKKSA